MGKLWEVPRIQTNSCKVGLRKTQLPWRVALIRCFWSKDHFVVIHGNNKTSSQQIPSSTYCPQVAKIINEMNGVAFNFTQKMRCLYLPSHHKYKIPSVLQCCHIITTAFKSLPYLESLKGQYRPRLPFPEACPSLDLYPEIQGFERVGPHRLRWESRAKCKLRKHSV